MTHFQPNREDKGAARAWFAFQPDLSPHQPDEPAADCQAKTGAAMLARGGHVRLRKGLEQA